MTTRDKVAGALGAILGVLVALVAIAGLVWVLVGVVREILS